MSGGRLRARLVNFGLAFVSLSVCLLLIEGAARWGEARRVSAARRLQQTSGSAVRFHPVLGWEKTPGGTARVKRGEFDVVLHANSHGLRGPERDYACPAGTRRVLILGDSFAAGYYVLEDQMLASVLERRLNGRACGQVEVLNGATAGYSTDQEYLFYKTEGQRYAPRAVVLLFYYNDLYYNTRATGSSGEPKPWFDWQAGQLTLRNVPLTAPAPGSGSRVGEDIEGVQPWRGSIALRLLSKRTADSLPRVHDWLAASGLVPPSSGDPHPEMWVYGPGAANPEMWKTTAELLRLLKVAAEAHAARLIVLYVPARFEVNEGVWDLTRARYGMGRRWRREKVFEGLSATCARLGVPLVDPRAALRTAEASPRAAYYTRDAHWNSVGNSLAAETLDGAVRQALDCGAPTAVK